MEGKIILKLITLTTLFSIVIGNPVKTDDGELEVTLQFLEFELEDICVQRSEAEWNFLNGTESDLKKLLDIELKKLVFYKKELQELREHTGKTFSSERLQRLIDILFHPGAPLLDTVDFQEYRDYSTKLQQLNAKATIECKCVNGSDASHTEEKCRCTERNVEEKLRDYKSADDLKELWTKWFLEMENSTEKNRIDFLHQLEILDFEAEQNGEDGDDLASYWLKQGEITWVNYETVLGLWKEIIPLFNKIRSYIANFIVQNHGKDVFINQKLIPAHLLGSLKSDNWIVAVEKLGDIQYSEAYQKLTKALKEQTYQDLYKMADNLTSELKLGELPNRFYYNSKFNVSGETCRNKIVDYCKREHDLRAMACIEDEITISRFLQINEEMMATKHLLLAGREEEEEENENGYLFREGPRDSAIYEAVASLSSLLALNPINLRKQNLLPNNTVANEEMLTLLLSALHVVPSLPYYLAADLWRINTLKEIESYTPSIEISESTSETSSTSESTKNLNKRDVFGFDDEDEEEEEEKKEETVKNEVEDEDKENEEKTENKDEDQEKDETSENKEKESSEVTTVKAENQETTTSVKDEVTDNQATKEPKPVYDFRNATSNWWHLRGKYQGIGAPDGKPYPDFFQDEKIIWNKPYISKFLGKLLQFQILEHFKAGNATANTAKLQLLLKKGKSKPWEKILQEEFNITEISVKPLLNYFKPLEEFLDNGGKFQNKTPLFNPNEFKLFSHSSSLSSEPEKENKESKEAEGSDALLFTLGVIAALGVVAIVVTVGRRRYKKKKRARKLRKFNATYNN